MAVIDRLRTDAPSRVMAGLVPAIHAVRHRPMRGGWVYIMTNHANGVLYVGVTSDLSRRAYEHREGLVGGFTKRYGLKRLGYFERFEDIRDAIQRESWKVRLILDSNPEWRDLYEDLA